MSIKSGGAAFPSPLHHEGEPGHESEVFCPGMTLRDWFAGQALVALVAHPQNGSFEAFAEAAYLQADAMLVAREQEPK